jgi:hypothetical protein
VSETGEILKRPGARPGRCSTHPSEPAVASCAICQRDLCLECAIPVRGRVVGPECLRTLVEDLPEQPPPPPPGRPRGDWFALVGFVVVLVASVFRWATFAVGGGGLGEAWRLHWSLLAVTSSALGVVAVVVVRRRGLPARPTAAVYGLLAALVATGLVLHAIHPPPVSSGVVDSWAWRAAVLGAVLALVGAGRKLLGAAGR